MSASVSRRPLFVTTVVATPPRPGVDELFLVVYPFLGARDAADAGLTDEQWIDRETLLVVRTHGVGDPLMGTAVQEVVSFSFVEHPAELFEPPA